MALLRSSFSTPLREKIRTFIMVPSTPGGTLSEVSTKTRIALNQRTHVMATLDAQRDLKVYVNGKIAGSAKGRFVTGNPNEGLDIGADHGSFVGNYSAGNAFKGSLRDIRVYWGVLDATGLAEWARP